MPTPDQATFDRLADEWERETRFLSNMHHMVKHPAYRQIIDLGEPAVPWLLARLERRSGHWFGALNRITGAQPVPWESRGIFEEMAAAWLEWGRQQGYEWTAVAAADDVS